MKHLTAITLLVLALISVESGRMSLAQSPAIPQPPADEHGVPPVDGSLENCSYIGVATSIAPALLREQLNLPRGVGVLIDDVDPDSPAFHAGLQPHDVIQKMDDQWVINVQQFSVLVRMKKPGDSVRLSIIHHGQPQDMKVTLGEKELPVLEDTPVWPHTGAPIPRAGTGRVTGIINHSDNDCTITIIARDDDRQVVVRDRNTGRVIFDGVVDSPEDLDKLSPELADKVRQVERAGNEHLNELRGAAHANDTLPNGD